MYIEYFIIDMQKCLSMYDDSRKIMLIHVLSNSIFFCVYILFWILKRESSGLLLAPQGVIESNKYELRNLFTASKMKEYLCMYIYI